VAAISMYVDVAPMPARAFLTVYRTSPGADIPVGRLDAGNPTMVINSPGTYNVKRGGTDGFNVGAISDT